jgi:homoprotocatechuate degradation regulator HpaR
MKHLPSTQRSLPIALIRAREHVMTPIRQMLSESGLTEQQWRVLRVLDEHGALEPSQLAEHAALLLPSQTRIVQSMAQKGLLVRCEHKNDRRRTVIKITDAGQAIINDNAAKAAAIAGQFRDKLGPRRFETLLDILDDLRELE